MDENLKAPLFQLLFHIFSVEAGAHRGDEGEGSVEKPDHVGHIVGAAAQGQGLAVGWMSSSVLGR